MNPIAPRFALTLFFALSLCPHAAPQGVDLSNRDDLQLVLSEARRLRIDTLPHYRRAVDECRQRLFADYLGEDVEGQALPTPPFNDTLFALYAEAHPASPEVQRQGFLRKSRLDHAYDHFLAYDPALQRRLSALSDSLLMAIAVEQAVDRHIDSSALEAHFLAHRARFKYPTPHCRGVIVHAANKRAAKQARRFLKSLPEEERIHAAQLTFAPGQQADVTTQQGLFAMGDNAYVDALVFGKQKPTPIDGLPITIWVGKKMAGPNNYHEVEDLVRTDLRQHLLAQWIDDLRSRRGGTRNLH